MKTVNYEYGIYSLNLSQSEIIMLVSGYIPYVVFENDPEIPDDETIWIYYEPKENDIIPHIYPFPCRIISYVTLSHQTILTLVPNEFNAELMEMIEKFKVKMERAGECVHSTASLPRYALS